MSSSDCLIFFGPILGAVCILGVLSAWIHIHDMRRLGRINRARVH